MKEQKVETVKLDNYEINDPDKAFDLFKTSFKFFYTFAPIETVRNKSTNKPPWFTNYLSDLRTKRNAAHKKWEVSQNDFQLFDKK